MDDTAPRRIYRSRTERVIAGVGGGIADYLGIDPVLVRVAFVALGISGVGVVLYIIGIFTIPEAPEGYVTEPNRTGGSATHFVIGVLLVAAGILYMVDWVFPIRQALWPLTLIAVGVSIVMYGVRK